MIVDGFLSKIEGLAVKSMNYNNKKIINENDVLWCSLASCYIAHLSRLLAEDAEGSTENSPADENNKSTACSASVIASSVVSGSTSAPSSRAGQPGPGHRSLRP